jgi:AraC-like DNA-binding protein
MNEKTLREKLQSSPALLKALEERALTNAEVADRLKVNESYLSTVFNTITRKKRGDVAVQREAEHSLAESRRQLRIREARKVLRGTRTLEKAANAANCSTRTMRRYVEKIAPKVQEEAYE